MTTRISIDESGYTGPDLTNVLQPNFVVASTILTDAEAQEILSSVMPKTQAEEFKFKNVWKSEAQRNALPDLCEALIPHMDRLFVWRIQKRFALFVKMIDYLEEPVFHARGYDFYAPWYAQSYCNTVYRDITDCETNFALYNNLTSSWNNLARYPTKENLQFLKKYVESEIPKHQNPNRLILQNILNGILFFEARGGINNFNNTNEIQFTSVLSSVSHWIQNGHKPVEVAHDQSNNFFSQAEMWETITSSNQPDDVHTLGNGTKLTFPLGVEKTEAVDSRLSPAIQLVDLVAGLSAKLFNARDDGKIAEILKKCLTAGFGEMPMSGSAPGTKYVNALPPKLVGQDALDQFTDVIFPKKHEKS